ncbi:hypothetical protein TSUD_227430 [Trifolium subterraneum]|uniref:F-box domain-containing protein n=1 Tax=Trifolium subterraneum TaxID=3900 RepID=A0A2Z6MKN3_TRISU|nr:hypothetical protein TSUD_227430 [Trifolium subterraneum]
MAQGRQEEDRNDDPLTQETTNTKRQRLITSTTTLTSLPFDLLSQILCKLPVRLLVQLRCLCKSFNSLISDPKFAKNHLRLSTKQHHLMLSTRDFLLYDSPLSSVLSTSTITQTQLNYPVTGKIHGISEPFSFSTCDGIFCFAIYSTSVILWNPSIRKFRLLPTPSENPRKTNTFLFSIFSFGHDPFTDSYKIICVSLFRNQTKVRVNTMGTNDWRRIQDFPRFSATLGPCGGPGVSVNGTVNWLTSIEDFDLRRNSTLQAIVSLDLAKESYQNISQPEWEKGILYLRLGRVRDCLCIFASNKMFLDVWIMKEYGNKESWNKPYHVPYIVERGLSPSSGVLYISQDDQLLMSYHYLDGGLLKLVVYGSKDGTSNIPDIRNTDSWAYPIVYVESLISPCS